MLSGATPSVSGIIGNDWFDRASGKTVTSVSDDTVQVLGSLMGDAASPHRLMVTTVGDELKMASTAPKGSRDAPRVFSASLKDRSAILPVGRGANGAYWLDTRSGAFVTSTYYGVTTPVWLDEFNAARLVDTYAGRPWIVLPATPGAKPWPVEPGPALNNAVFASP
jgi:hypothetical protein